MHRIFGRIIRPIFISGIRPDTRLPCRGQVKNVAIRSPIHTSVCGNPRDGYSILGNPRSKRRALPNPRHTFERGTWQETEFQLPPYYIESPPV
jgi:hypothetical protein